MEKAKDTLKEIVQNTINSQSLSFNGFMGLSNDNMIIPFTLNNQTSSVLVMGKPNMGENELLRTITYSVMAHANPKQLQVAVIDGKGDSHRLLGNSKNPFLYAPIPDASKDKYYISYSRSIIKEIVDECKDRFELFKANGVSNIENYNLQNEETVLPIIWLIITDFDYLTALDGEVNAVLGRRVADNLEYLIKMGRSLGIRVLLSTHFADTGRIPLKIAQNIPNRIAFSLRNHSETQFAFGKTRAKAERIKRQGMFMTNFPKHGLMDGHTLAIDLNKANELNNQLRGQFRKED